MMISNKRLLSAIVAFMFLVLSFPADADAMVGVFKRVVESATDFVRPIFKPRKDDGIIKKAPQQNHSRDSSQFSNGKTLSETARSATVKSEVVTVVTLVDHVSGMPLVSLDLRDEGGEIAAVLALLEEADVEGKVITLDALHTTKKTASVIVRTHKADYMFTVKGNSSLAYERLRALDWENDSAGRFTEKLSKGHGRVEQRSIQVMNSYFRLTDYPHVKQVFKVKRWSKDVKTQKESLEYAYGITSVNSKKASPQELLEWNRGHWAVESKNHYLRDVTFGEDSSMTRVNNEPANNAVCNNIALAVIVTVRRSRDS